MCGIRVLSALLKGRPLLEEDWVRVPVALLGVRVVEGQPLFQPVPCVAGLDAALLAVAGEPVGRGRRGDVSLRVDRTQGLQSQVGNIVGELVRQCRRPVQGAADAWFGGCELVYHRPRGATDAGSGRPVLGVVKHGPPYLTFEGVAAEVG